MKTRSQLKCLYALVILVISDSCTDNTSRIVKYPSIDSLETSEIYEVQVNNRSIWVEKFRTEMDINDLAEWFTSEPYTKVQQEVHIVNFSCQSQILIAIRANEHINTVNIRPRSRDVEYIVEGNIVRFSLPGPDKLYIEINNLPPLCFFANPVEEFVPDEQAPNVMYFGPGVHYPGMMTLEDNETLYIAGGALVYGGIRVKGSSNIKVMGRGILDGGFEHKRMVVLEHGSHIEFNGILIRNGVSWTNTIINCSDVKYENVKVISFGPGGDGINPLGTQKMEISNCFLRCTDDCIAIKSPDSTHIVKDIKVLDNTMIGYAFSDGVTIGFETNGPYVEDVEVKDCDILLARGGSRVDGHSAFSIICDGPAIIRNIVYENIRIDKDVLKLFELHITDGTKYGINPPGHIKNIHLKDIHWLSKRPIILRGFDETHRVQDIVFENCTIEGMVVDDPWPDIFEINEYVDNVQFIQ
jgi:hypothetical protein